MSDNDTKETARDAKIYELVISFVQPEKAMIRLAASSEEMAKAALREMTDGVVRDLEVLSIKEIEENEPVPEEYEEGTEVDEKLKTVH